METNSTFFVIHHINTVYRKTSKNAVERIGADHSEIISNYINRRTKGKTLSKNRREKSKARREKDTSQNQS